MKKALLFLVLYWILCSGLAPSARGQQYAFQKYSLREGLVQSQVRCIHQDSRGYIWVGTLGGLSRFDGQHFVNYSRRDGLPDNQISDVVELHDGTIAAGSVGGISMIRAGRVQTYLFPDSLREAAVNTLFEDAEQGLWIGTEDGVLVFSDGKFTDPGPDPAFDSHIKSFKTSSGGTRYMVARDAIYRMEVQGLQVVFRALDEETSFFDLAFTKEENMLIAARGRGLIQIDKQGQEIPVAGLDRIPATTITGIIRGSEGEFWLSSRFGFFRYKDGEVDAFTDRQGLPTPDVRDLMLDREGNIWIASYGSGLLRFTGELFAAYTTREGLSSNAVMSITQDPQGAIWLSTFDKGICQFRGDSVVPVPQTRITGSNRIWTSLCDRKGTLWFGSSDGLFAFREGSFIQYTEADSLPDRMVLSLFETTDGRLVIGTAEGPCIMHNGEIQPFGSTPGFEAFRIRGIAEDRAGNLWFAAREGVFSYDGRRFNAYGTASGLPDNSVYCVAVDEFNRVWAGTQSGLAVRSGEGFKTVSVDNAPGSQTINFMNFSHGFIWLGTLNGLFRASLDPGREDLLDIRQFGPEDGLLSLETNLNAVFQDRQGTLWIGTPEGVMRMDTHLAARPLPKIQPILNLRAVFVNLLEPDWAGMKMTLDPISGLPVNPEVDHKKNHFTFYFDGISTTYPADVVYQYMLEGLDEDWQPLTTSDFATYSNLPYSSFVFKVRARGKGGEWSEVVTFPFTIRPPFWLSWWFILLVVLVSGLIVFALIAARQRNLRNEREREMFEMKSRMLALEQQSLNSSMNRHFIFNALNSIQYYINRQDRIAANRYLSDFAKLIRKNLDSSQENTTPLREEIERLELYLKLEHMRFQEKFEYRVHVDPALDQDQIRVPSMLLQPFLENSIWHGLLPKDAPGRVDVDIHRLDGHIEFTITDNGIGIEQSLRSKTGTDSHISKGMQITGNRVELIKKMTGRQVELHGPYQLHGDQGQPTGTQVRIIMPLDFGQLFGA